MSQALHALLSDFMEKPEPFSRYTTRALWTRPHLAKQMLEAHLDPTSDRASRSAAAIESTAMWIHRLLDISDKQICDLGCGPGLYAQAFAERGARVTGLDFSHLSIDYARSHDQFGVSYAVADYLEDSLPTGFDIVSLIFCDFCALSYPQRRRLLDRIHRMLKPGGYFVLDVSFDNNEPRNEDNGIKIEANLMNGFWSESDYIGFKSSFEYPTQRLSLERYLILEPGETWQIFNWNQRFTVEDISRDLLDEGFNMEHVAASLSGDKFTNNSSTIGLIVSTASAP